MMTKERKIRIGVFLASSGQHVAAWRHPNAVTDGSMDLPYFIEMAQLAESGKLDFIFLADSLAINEGSHPNILTRFEPLTILSILSTVTKEIGLAATASTTYEEPYHLARKFSSLDHLSSGRAGWNIVTSSDDQTGYNFSRAEHMEHGLRYERAEEFVDVVKGLWNSWNEEDFIRDQESGAFIQQDAFKRLNHKGTHFNVRGPLNISRSPQGEPVYIQAGSSEAGQLLAAKTADVVFTAQNNLADAQVFYRSIKEKVKSAGRDPEDVLVMPGLFPIIGDTQEDADAKFRELQDLISPEVGLEILSDFLGDVDLSIYPVDGPLPDLSNMGTNQLKSRFDLIVNLADRNKYSIKQLYEHVAASRGHFIYVGTKEGLVDVMEEWFTRDAADGFNLLPPLLPNSLEDFVHEVIPLLQERGLYQTEYTGATFRERIGLGVKDS